MKDAELFAELSALIPSRGDKRGVLKASDVVRYAEQHRDSKLGKRIFKDSNEVAAMKFRLMEARKIISAWKEYSNAANREVRVMVSVPSDRAVLGAYRKTSDVVENPRWRGELVEEALNKIGHMRQSYSYLPELTPLWNRIDADIAAYREQIAERAQAG